MQCWGHRSTMELFLYLLHSAEDTGLQWSSSSSYYTVLRTQVYNGALPLPISVLRTQVYNGALPLAISHCWGHRSTMELFLYIFYSTEDTGLQWSSSSTYFTVLRTQVYNGALPLPITPRWGHRSTMELFLYIFYSTEDTGLQWSSSSTYFTVLRTQVYNGALSLHILQCHVVLLRKLCHSGGLVINSVTHKEMRAQATAE